MAFIDIAYLQSLGFRIPQSSVSSVTQQLDKIIEDAELEYLQNTIGYTLTSNLYALVDPLPPEVVIFLDGSLVDGDAFYYGVKLEIANFIMAQYYSNQSLSVNNSGFSMPFADGENMIAPDFVVNSLLSRTHQLRPLTYEWLKANNTDFFETWLYEYFKDLERGAIW